MNRIIGGVMDIRTDESRSLRRITKTKAVVTVACIVASQLLEAQNPRGAGVAANSQIIEDLVTANRILANEGIVDGLGHVSVRHDQTRERFLLARLVAPVLVTAEDLMEYDLDGNPVDPRGRAMYTERFIHAAIYQARPDVQAVVHCHTPSVIPFANSNVPIRPMYHMSAFLTAGASVFEIRRVGGATGMLVSDARLGQALAQTLGDKTVVLMRGHGAVVVGGSIPEAVARSIYLDINAKMQAQAMALGGTVRYLGPEDMAAPTSAQPAAGVNPTGRDWQHWKQRALGR